MGGCEQRGDFFGHLFDARFIHAVDFGDDHRAVLNMQQIQNVQVFQRLRHRAVVSGDHQQRVVDAAHARQHVAHKTLVTRHIHKADEFAVGQRQIGKTQINRNAACLFLRQAVSVYAGERFHQQGLAVIDMASGGDYH